MAVVGASIAGCTAAILFARRGLRVALIGNAALARYRRHHRTALRGPNLHINWFASGRPLNLVEKLLFAAGAKDTVTARRRHRYGARTMGFFSLISPPNLAQAAWALIASQQQTPTV